MTICADFLITLEKTSDEGGQVVVYKKWEADDPWEIRDILQYSTATVEDTARYVINMIDDEAWATSNVFMGSAQVYADVLETAEGRDRFVAKFKKDAMLK